MDANIQTVAVSDEGLGESLYGWLPVAVSAELERGKAIPIRVHGREVVLWRGESGQPHALDAYCAHLGHHLGYLGRVCGEDVRCFYHGWTWSPEGTNTDVPYDRRVYKGRRISRWAAADGGGLIYLWYPGSGDKSKPARSAPEFDTAGVDCVDHSDLATDPRLVVEQFVDPMTLGYFVGDQPLTSTVMSVAESTVVIQHTFEARPPVAVEIHDSATVVVRDARWSLLVGVCPIAAGNTKVWSTVTVTTPSLSADTGQLRRDIEAALDRALDVAARMAYVQHPQGVGAEIIETYRRWVARPRETAE